MQLLYLWIERTENSVIKEQGFNFSGKYYFEYAKENHKLIVSEKNGYIEGFFDETGSIIDITAIVGANGAGKTTILKELMKFDDLVDKSIKNKVIIVFKDLEQDAITVYHNYSAELECSSYIDTQIIPPIKELDHTLIYLSNVLDRDGKSLYSQGLEGMGTYDISTTALLNNSSVLYKEIIWYHDKTISLVFPPYDELVKLILPKPIEVYERLETLRQIKFALDKKAEENFAIRLPDEVEIYINLVDTPKEDNQVTKTLMERIKYKRRNYKQIYFKKNKNSIKRIKHKCRNYKQTYLKKSKNNIERIMDKLTDKQRKYVQLYFKKNKNNTEDFAYKMLFNYLCEATAVLSLEFEYNKRKGIDKNLCDFKKILEDRKEKEINENEMYRENINDIFNYYIDAIEQIKIWYNLTYKQALKDNGWPENDAAHTKFLSLKFNDNKERELLNKIIQLYDKPKSFIAKYIVFKWRNVSSGEYYFLSMYSRLYWLLKNEKIKKNIILLIDEVDLYFHPKWQRELISNLIDDLQKVLGKDKKMQIIFTTHSPIVLSDIPKSNIIFMKWDGGCKVVDNEERKSTFAANIHTLFLDSFFLEKDGIIGKLAEEKVNFIINQINYGNINEYEQARIYSVINNIGEPLVKNKLLEMFNRKFPFTHEKRIIEDKIKQLQDRLKEIEQSGSYKT